DFTQDTDTQAWAWEGVAVDHCWWQAQGYAQFAHFVLEQFAQGFQQFQVQRVWQAAHVVVGFDASSFAGFGSGGFDDVRVDCALGQPAGVAELGGFFLEDFHEFTANDLAFGFWVGHTGQFAQEAVGSVDMDDLQTHIVREGAHDLLGFVQTQQAVVHEYAGQLVADSLVDQSGSDGGIHTAGQSQNNFFVADLFADIGNSLLHVVRHVPITHAAANVAHKAFEQGAALDSVSDFGVELNRVEAAIFISHTGDGACRRGSHQLEAGRQGGNFVAVAHPDFEHAVAFCRSEILNTVQQLGVAVGADFGVTEFTLVRAFGNAAQLAGHGLHAVANAQNGYAGFKRGGRNLQSVFGVDRGVAARQNDPFQAFLGTDEFIADITGVNFTVRTGFAYATRNKLGDLGAVIKNQNSLVHESIEPIIKR